MAMPLQSLKLTYDDYTSFRDDGQRHEIVDGEHYVSPAPIVRHQALIVNLLFALKAYLRENPVGQVLVAPTDVVLSPTDVVQPDLLFISTERASIVGEMNVQGAPDLVIEITSEASRRYDEITKRKLYERFGVGEYWVGDPELETFKVYRREGSAFRRVAELSREAGDVLTTPLLPALAIPLAEIFG